VYSAASVVQTAGGVRVFLLCDVLLLFGPVCVLRCVGSPDCGGVRVLVLLRLDPCGPCKYYITTLLG
jgi:hypothetical protein